MSSSPSSAHEAPERSHAASADEIAGIVQTSIDRGLPIVDYGVAHGGLGHAPPRRRIDLSLTGDVLDHHVADMMVRVSGGCTVGRLFKVLGDALQFLPIDADDDLTLSELVQHNVYGPLRVRYGTVRDLLLGLAFIDAQGRDVRVGGITVKNVAGYDLTRFMVGSLGELGIVHELNLRTYALPPQVTTVTMNIEDPRLPAQRLTDWMLTDAAPTAMDLTCRGGSWLMRMAYHGTRESCAVQTGALEQLIRDEATLRIVGRCTGSLLDCRRAAMTSRAWRRTAPCVVKLMVRPADTGIIGRRLAEQLGGAELMLDALPAHGVLFAGGPLDHDALTTLDALVDQVTRAHGGAYAWMRRPTSSPPVAPMGPPQSDWPLLAKLKRTFDPHGRFNPGRFLSSRDVSEKESSG